MAEIRRSNIDDLRTIMRINLVSARGNLSAQFGWTGNIRIGVRRLQNVLLLVDAVLAFRIQDVRHRKAVVKQAVSSAQRERRLLRPEVPREAKTRRNIAVIRDVVLNLVTQSVAQREFGLHLPVVLKEQPEVRHAGDRGGIPRGQGELAGSSARSTNLLRSQSLFQPLLRNLVGIERSECVLPIKVRCGVAGFARTA